jgi:tetratricopeptide (TPR) repeat protein
MKLQLILMLIFISALTMSFKTSYCDLAELNINSDSTFFENYIETPWQNGQHCTVKHNVDKYLRTFPEGVFTPIAHFYKAECLSQELMSEEAILSYEEALKYPNNIITEMALKKVSNLYFYTNKYEQGLKNYQRLDLIASGPSNKFTAQLGQLRCSFKLGLYLEACQYARLVLENKNARKANLAEAQCLLGISLFNQQLYGMALIELHKCNSMTKSILGSEAKYYMALIYFKKGDYARCVEKIYELIKGKPSYDYWIASSLILLADNYTAQLDYFQAKITVQSVIDNYSNTNDDILSLAKEMLAKIILKEDED